MYVEVYLYTGFRSRLGWGYKRLSIGEGYTIRDLIDDIEDLKELIREYESTGVAYSILVNGVNIAVKGIGLDYRLSDGDKIVFYTLVSGGYGWIGIS